jgi:lipid II:glycine glycyltransferase (peptidoglycan interpeptide bridge formation enzyme)
MAIVSLADWNHFLQGHPHAHLLQTGEWGELKADFGWKAVRIIQGEHGAQILFRKLPWGFTIGYIPKPVISDQLPVTRDPFWSEVDEVCRKRRAIFLKIEPDVWEPNDSSRWALNSDPKSGDPSTPFVPPVLTCVSRTVRARRCETAGSGQHFGLHKSPHNIQPPRTIIVDISCAEDMILARMKQKTRYNIRLAEKKGVTVRAWDDIPEFHKMLFVTGERDGFGVHSLDYYQLVYDLMHPSGMCEILLAEFEGKPLASLLVARQGDRAYYLYGASTDEERNRMPTYLLQWEALKWAKSHGCKSYDLWGVPDEDEGTLEANFEKRQDGLWGVYRFKRGFGGELKRAAQALDRIYKPLLYQLYLWHMAGRENG